MENMNLASRCREAISHVAMLKKELALQQKRTAQALASQREQTKRMADSLTNSFISFSSNESPGSPHRISSSKKNTPRYNGGIDEEENVMRLVSSTPSPDRDAVQQRQRSKIKLFDDQKDEKQSNSKPTVQTVPSSRTKKPEESRDSPATTATTAATTATIGFEEEIEVNNISSSRTNDGPDDELTNNRSKEKQRKKEPVLYSTPKKSDSSKSPFNLENGDGFGDMASDKKELFPVSASPKVFKSNRDNKSYDEGFPSDGIDKSENDNIGKYAKPKQMNFMNSIDAFEQSFSTDFPDSFTPKESNNYTSSPRSGQKPYNPFFATPEKQNSRGDSRSHGPSKQVETNAEKVSPIDYRTPPKDGKSVPAPTFEKNDKDSRPKRPEKTIPYSARARYERVLAPRSESSTQSKHPVVGNEAEKKTSSGNSPGALRRRMQQRKQLDKNLESISNGVTMNKPVVEPSPSEQKHQSRKEIVDILDTFENIENVENGTLEPKPSSASRFSGPIKSLRRRSVKKPISYAEPPLNTKLRRGDTFFPKTNPDMTTEAQVPNVIQTSAVVSP